MKSGQNPFRIAALFFAFVLAPDLAQAGGFGAYFEYPRGDQQIDFGFVDADFTNNRFGAGMVLDTNVARNELLNVRASVGYVRTENDVDDQANGGAFDLAVGFGLWRTRDFRLWAAPAVRFGVDYYENEFAQVLDLGFGGGARVGLNWHVTDQISVAPSIAYQYMYIREKIEDDFGKDQFNGREQLVTARISFLFRDPGDVFSRRHVGRVVRSAGSPNRVDRSGLRHVRRTTRSSSD